MDKNFRCDDFLFANKSSSNESSPNDSCDKLLKKSKNRARTLQDESFKCETPPGDFISSTSLSSMSTSGLLSQRCCSTMEPLLKAPNISHELAVAKSALQQLSSISGDNLFDHLSDIIKRVIDERPPNVIDFFEEFSRNVREQKYHLPERFPPHAVFKEKRVYKVAKKQLISLNLPFQNDLTIPDEDDLEEDQSGIDILKMNLSKQDVLEKFHIFNDRVQYLQFFWNQCGFSISSEDVFHLACSMNFLQSHPSIMQCRFWGIINGLKASYYIVEAILTNDEYRSRVLQMKKEMEENIASHHLENDTNQKVPSHIGPELTPGAVGWENHAEAEILKMKPQALPVPLAKKAETFDIPPEPIGSGVNRFSYFVVNSLSDEWIELPIVTPRQICASRDIKKFFTGDLEQEIVSYPCFNGQEKHYLRAMIARITAGTYIAPNSYYRKMTTNERRLFEGEDGGDHEDDNENEAEDQENSQSSEEIEDKENELDNDILLVKNDNYDSSVPLKTLKNPEKWVHVRPNILLQGRVVWYDEENSEKQKEKEHTQLEETQSEDSTEEDESDYSDDNEDRVEEKLLVHAEKGPSILTSCSRDINSETPVPWVARFTSKFTNKNERILVMQSNIWSGAYTFLFRDLCESIYLGWGHKTVSRNMTWKHLPPIEEEYEHKKEDYIETIDPSVEMEKAYHSSLLRKELMQEDTINIKLNEHETAESSDDREDDDDDDDEEEEE